MTNTLADELPPIERNPALTVGVLALVNYLWVGGCVALVVFFLGLPVWISSIGALIVTYPILRMQQRATKRLEALQS